MSNSSAWRHSLRFKIGPCLFMLIGACASCQQSPPVIDAATDTTMKTIGLIYGRFVAQNRGKRPGDLVAFKAHADANCQRLLKVAQVTSADELLKKAEEFGELTMVFAGQEITVDGLDEKQVVAIAIPAESNIDDPEVAVVVDSLGVVERVDTIKLQGL